MDLADVVLTSIGTAAGVSTAVATGVTLFLRHRDRQEPGWAITGAPRQPDRENYGVAPELHGHLDNAGDGTAFRVTAAGLQCEVRPTGPRSAHGSVQFTHVAAMAPGGSIDLWAQCPFENWNSAAIIVEWTRPPTRLRKRLSQTLPLREIADCPQPPDAADSA